MKFPKAALFAGVPAVFLLVACSEPAPGGASAGADAPVVAETGLAAPAVATTPLEVPPVAASASPAAQAIDQAVWSAAPATPQAKRDAMIRAQVLLARAHFSPGVIDGADGGNVRNAVSAFEAARNLPVDGAIDDQVWAELAKDAGPVMTDYTITEADIGGPFVATIPTKYDEMAKLETLAFTGPAEGLAEKFHMDEALLKALNPEADFTKAGTVIVVAAPSLQKLPTAVTRIEVDKTKRQVRAYGAGDALVAVYPATVGSSDRPAPTGEWAVRTIAPNPTYTYDPTRLTFGDKKMGKLTIKAGPNNPVGGTWIDLTKDTYGIHGTPDPRLVGKTASHGCVRLTNWDVKQLSQSVSKETKVVFVGTETTAPAKTST